MYHTPSDEPVNISFSKRQMEIITAWGAYPNIEELARHMNMSVNTVQTHLKRMRKKLKVRKTVEVWLWTQKALDEGKM